LDITNNRDNRGAIFSTSANMAGLEAKKGKNGKKGKKNFLLFLPFLPLMRHTFASLSWRIFHYAMFNQDLETNNRRERK
jgi:hypothetical protein